MGNEESVLEDPNVPPETLKDRSLESLAHYMKHAPARRIVVMCGAGISTAAGSTLPSSSTFSWFCVSNSRVIARRLESTNENSL